MATDDDASGADPEGDGTDASGGDGEDSPSTLQGDAVDRGTDDEGAGDLPATDDERRTANSAEQPPARPDETADTEDDAHAAGGDTDAAEATDESSSGPGVVRDEYTWADFLDEYGVDGDVKTLYRGIDPREIDDEEDEGSERWDDGEPVEVPTPTREDWDAVSLDPESYLGFHPVEVDDEVDSALEEAVRIQREFESFCDPATTPVVKDVWLWEHYKREYYYEEDGSRPRDEDGEIERFDSTAALGFDPDDIESVLDHGNQRASELQEIVDKRTVDVDPEFDEDAFFTDERGATTVVNRYDLEKAVPMEKKGHFREVERYWVNEPHSFVIIFHSRKENEKKYYVIEPHQNRIEADLTEFLTGKLRTAIKYDDGSVADDTPSSRRRVIEQQALELLERYNLYKTPDRPRQAGLSILATGPTGDTDEDDGLLSGLDVDLGLGAEDAAEDASGRTQRERRLASFARTLGLREGSLGGRFDDLFESSPSTGESDSSLEGIAARPEPAVLAEDSTDLTDYQVEKLLYALRRDFIGYERIDGIKHDVNVEDISCDGYNSPVFVYHSDYEQIITNVYHGEEELDDFVVKLAQRSGKGISKRRPQVDATLPDGSRAQLTLGREVSDHGTNYTIRQFKDVPYTPIDLVNWKTFSLEEMAFLWLCIENDKSLIFAGGTASGKTTSLNAVSLFIPSNSKIVSIEDTREVELPQRNWVASVTRPSFSDDDRGDVDEFDLLEAALRQRPDYIVMGEIRGEEGRTLFQVMSTGHTTYTTFHADSVGEVLKRFTTDPINVSKTMFTALDLVSVQTSTRVQGDKVRRNKALTEINHYDAENDEINVQDVYQWQAEGDEFLKMGSSNTLEDIRFDRGWTRETLDDELFKRHVVIAYLIDRGLNTYTEVAATLQAFINDQETILALMARDELERSLEDLREMESVQIDVDPEKEEMVPRPSPSDDVRERCQEILERAESEVWPEYRDLEDVDVADALLDIDTAPDVTAAMGDHPELDALEERTETPELDADPDGEGEPDALESDNEGPPALDAAGPDDGSVGDDGGAQDDGPTGDGEADRDGDVAAGDDVAAASGGVAAADPNDDASGDPTDEVTEASGEQLGEAIDASGEEPADAADDASGDDPGDDPDDAAGSDGPLDGALADEPAPDDESPARPTSGGSDEELSFEELLSEGDSADESDSVSSGGADDEGAWDFGDVERPDSETDARDDETSADGGRLDRRDDGIGSESDGHIEGDALDGSGTGRDDGDESVESESAEDESTEDEPTEPGSVDIDDTEDEP
ncbi:ATPase, T2SS/T4P/T4SS family [Halobellus clavatus]|uniref:Flagellar protein FlaI n=1 Tax=Halobellus clavatus TaxID=660517 RepID=A0A1H3D449_9EURY|nr:ATPase, T2SS/T4P/T4SS family [Halobellus clavatus]SDX61126.1 flagellar protein FlaI [Halobellus clavatus]